MRSLLGILLAATLFASCNEDNPVSVFGEVRVVTDRSEVTTGGGLLRSVLVNDSENPVYTLSCTDDVHLETQEAIGWKDLGAWYGVCDGPTIPIALEPGTYRDLPVLDAATVDQLGPGTYRIKVEVYRDNTFPYQLLPLSQRVSDPFRIIAFK